MANELKSTKINGDLAVTGNVNVSSGTITGNLSGTASSANTVKINSTNTNTKYNILVSPGSSIGAPLSHGNVAVNINNSGATTLEVTGTVNATHLTGDGSGITGINAANIVGNIDSSLFSVTDKKEIATAVNGSVTIGTANQPLTIKASKIDLNGSTTVNSDLKVNGNVNITGEANIGRGIKINGSTTIVDATTLSTGDTLIELGSGDRLSSAKPALASTQYAGFYVQKYDGEHSGALVFDNSGTAYVGDVQVSGNTIAPIDSSSNTSSISLQPLATRVKDIAHDSIIKWDNNDKTLKPIKDGDIKSVATGDGSDGRVAIVNPSASYSSIYRTGIKIQNSVNLVTSGEIESSAVTSSTVTASKISSEEIVNGKVEIAQNSIVVKASQTVVDVIKLDSTGNIIASTASIPNITGNLQGKATTAGTADVAIKLNTNAGSATQPIYFSGGKPVAITGAIANDTTGNAATTTKLQTARGISITGGASAKAVSFDGTKDISLNVESLNPANISSGIIGNDEKVVNIRGTADKAKQVNITSSTTGKFNIPYVSGSSGAQYVYAGNIIANINSSTNLVELGDSSHKINISGQADTVNEKIKLGDNLSGEVSLITKNSNNEVTLNANVKEIGIASSTVNVNVNQSLYLLKSKSLILQGANIPWYVSNSSNALTLGANNNSTSTYVFGADSAIFNKEIKANSNIAVSDSGKISSKYADLRQGFNIRLFDSVGTAGSNTNLDYVGLELIQGSKTGTDYNVGLRLNRKSYYTSNSASGYYQNNIPGNSEETTDARIIPLIFDSPNTNNLISFKNSSASGVILKYYKGAIIAANPGTDYLNSEGSFAAAELSSKILPLGSINLSDYQTSITTNTNVTVSITQSNNLVGVLPFFAINTASTDSNNHLYNFTLKPYVPEGIITQTTSDGKDSYVFNSNSDKFPVLIKDISSEKIKIDGTVTKADALNTSAGSATQPIYFANGKPVAITGAIANNTTGNAASASKLNINTIVGSANQPVYFANGVPVSCSTKLNVSISGKADTAGTADAALKLNTNAGSANQPVYFSNGVPVAITGAIANNITGNAATATKLQTAKTISIKGGPNNNASATFDGSNNVSITLTSGIITEALGFTPLKDSDAMSYRGSVTANSIEGIMSSPRVNGDVYLYNGDKITVGSSITGTTDLTVENGDMLVVYVSGNTKQWTVIERNNTDAVSFNGNTESINENTLAYFKTSGSKNISNSTIKISDNTITANIVGNVSGNLTGVASNATHASSATVATSLSTSAGSATQPIYFSGGKPLAITGAIANNTTGNAGSASKLSVNANTGSSSQPVYFSNGVPVAITGAIDNNITGNAATATTLQTARKISITGGATAAGVSFNGSSDISLNVTSITPSIISAGNINSNVNLLGNAATATIANYATNDSDGKKISDTYMKKSGGDMLLGSAINFIDYSTGNVTTSAPINLGGFFWKGKTDYISIYGELPTEPDQCHLVVKLGDDCSNKISIRSCTTAGENEVAWINANGYAMFKTVIGTFSGNATSATVATSLSTSAGSATQPIYFSGGKPVAITGAIANNTTGNAATASNLSKSSVGFLYQSANNTTSVHSFLKSSLLGTTGDNNPAITSISYSNNVVASGNMIVEAVNGNFTASTIHATTFIGAFSGNATSASKLSVNANTGANNNPVYFSNGVPVRCSETIGASDTPVYINNGTITAINGTLKNNAASADKLNTNAGSTTQPIYFSGGKPVAITGAIANNTTGSAAKLNTNAGSTVKPVFFSGGVPVQCAGPIQSPGFAIESDDNGTLQKRATISYNTTDQCIEFIFV